MLQRKADKQPLGIEQAESAIQRARSLGLIGESVGTTSFDLGRNIVAGVEASVVR
jgi:NADH:ubiquinone oxidoreductase subunit F (NADH-binding)